MAIETASNLVYTRILEYYGEEAFMPSNESPSAASTQRKSAPDYGNVYAGAYLNDIGNLVVLLADSSNGSDNSVLNFANQSNILSSEIRSNSDAFSALPTALKNEAAMLQSVTQNNFLIFQQAKYPYSYLKSLNTLLLGTRDSEANDPNSIWNDIVGFGIKDDINGIVVHVIDMDNNKIERFKQEISNSDALIFENASGAYGQDVTNLYLGRGICNAGGFQGSIGYKATRYLSNGSTQTGFVTAAHVVSSGLVRYQVTPNTSTWANLGTVRTSQNGGTVDAAFVEITESSLNLTNRVFNSTGITISSGYTTPAVGSTVCMAGAASGTYNYGSVISASYNGKTGYSDFVLTSYTRSEGDSGGVVFATSNGISRAVGIHHGWIVVNGATRSMYCKVANIAQVLNVSPV